MHFSYPNALRSNEDVDSPDRPQSPTHIPENLSPSGGDLSSSTIQEYNELKQETGLPSGGNTNSVAQTSSSYSFGLISPVVGSQIAAVENSDSQGRDASRLPSFVVSTQLSALLYANFYDSYGRLVISSIFHNIKYETSFDLEWSFCTPYWSISFTVLNFFWRCSY